MTDKAKHEHHSQLMQLLLENICTIRSSVVFFFFAKKEVWLFYVSESVDSSHISDKRKGHPQLASGEEVFLFSPI